MLVTAMEPRRKGLTALYVDGQEVLVDTETLLSRHIRLGDELEASALEELCRASEARRVRERALYILDYRDHSRAELHRKLRAASFSEEACTAAVEKMVELGLIDDREYARKLVAEGMLRKGFGERRMQTELFRRGIDREIAQEVMAEVEVDPIQQLVTVIGKKYTPLPQDEKGRRRMVNGLLRMGYGFGDIRSALSELEESMDDGNEWNE